jgi:hypothetical protein
VALPKLQPQGIPDRDRELLALLEDSRDCDATDREMRAFLLGRLQESQQGGDTLSAFEFGVIAALVWDGDIPAPRGRPVEMGRVEKSRVGRARIAAKVAFASLTQGARGTDPAAAFEQGLDDVTEPVSRAQAYRIRKEMAPVLVHLHGKHGVREDYTDEELEDALEAEAAARAASTFERLGSAIGARFERQNPLLNVWENLDNL